LAAVYRARALLDRETAPNITEVRCLWRSGGTALHTTYRRFMSTPTHHYRTIFSDLRTSALTDAGTAGSQSPQSTDTPATESRTCGLTGRLKSLRRPADADHVLHRYLPTLLASLLRLLPDALHHLSHLW
jgi:hypothetical protein